MRKLLAGLIASLFILFSTNSFSQSPTNETLFSIGNENVSSQEFLSVYKKNNMGKEVDMSENALRDYLNLYINFRLKVKEAKELHIDTLSSVNSELKTYRAQLAKGYLTDKEKIDALTAEAYERMKNEIHVMHILVKCDLNASAADTAKAFKKINDLKNLIAKGKDFSTVARDSSDDVSAKDNGGDLGFITSMQLMYPFENRAYSTAVGKVSDVFRTKFGYHIIKVLEKRPNQGTVQVEHIFIKVAKNASDEDKGKAKTKIDDIYSKLTAGDNFEDLAKENSEDKTTASDGGKLAAFGTGKMVPEFEKEAFALKNVADYSKPIMTKFGWHIIKLIDKKPLESFDAMKESLKKQIEKDPRADEAKRSFVNKIKKDYSFTENLIAKNDLYQKTDSSLLKGLYDATDFISLSQPLFTFTDNLYNPGSRSFTQGEFAKFVAANQRKFLSADKSIMFNNLYNQFVDNSAMLFEEDRLSGKYPAFKELMGEYNDGILLFELTDQKVWTKAVKDSAGLKTFYETDKGTYMSNDKAKVTTYTCANQTIADAVIKSISKGVTDDKIAAKLNKKSNSNLKVDYSTVEKGKQSEVETMGWEKGKNYITKTDNGGVKISRITEILPPAPKPLEEVRGYIVADYQEKLEKEWIQSLREKYPVKINENVLMGLVK
jgi:peptidyl-prolyl cis-trans isomerase SurA